ncbi:trypsin-like peptidase domain-containing protein [Catenuloplanes atrovinosus]|uniref:NB-ARC domain-containing protein n=1 Tax=Catenuloplanes atrovinosus TaxID=137266 RepID=A0AAE4C965_9ACTN|nr:trypsin-like peptidase domain-containing protein [Catenuloplanes atrovinosus]MDR7275728.1 hypothetical protein [Catenuloplanes atrovinosus]
MPGFLCRVLGGDGVPCGTGFQVAPHLVVTAWHVLRDAGGDRAGARLSVDALHGGVPPAAAEVIAGDPGRDLAVLRRDEPLPDTVAGLVHTGAVEPLTPVLVTGVSTIDDPGHVYRHLDATGSWQGGTVRDTDVRLGRFTSAGVVPGMSGAPVLRLADRTVVGVVSARYNSADGWLRDSVWAARTEDLAALLDGLPGIGVGRRLLVADRVSTVLAVRAPGAGALVAGAATAEVGVHEAALEAATVLTALDDSCRGVGHLGDLVESLVTRVERDGRHDRHAVGDLRARLRRHGLDPRVLFPAMAQHEEALRRWAAGGPAAGPLASLAVVLAHEVTTDVFAGLSATCRRYLREALFRVDSAGCAAFLDALAAVLPPLRSPSTEAVLVRPGNEPVPVEAARRSELASVAAQLCRLPDPDPYVAGRAEPVSVVAAAVRRRIAGHGSATAFLSGQPGVGTSTVAVEAARLLAPDFAGGVVYLDLHGLVAGVRRELSTMVRLISEALRLDLSVETMDDTQRAAALLAQLRDRGVLLVLDNARDAGHVAPLARAPRGCAVIVTARDRVQSFADPGLVFRAEPLAREDSVRVLAACDESRADRADLLHRIAFLCADVPLALRMIGARMASRPDLPLEYVLQTLEQETTRLDYLDAGDRAVRAAIRLSYDNLDVAARRVFRLVAAAPGSATTGAELGHCLGESALTQELLLNRLVDRSLAEQVTVRSPSASLVATVNLFDLVLLFARERLAEEEPEELVRDFRHRALGYLRDRLAEIVRLDRPPVMPGELDPSRFHAAARLAEEGEWFDLATELAGDLSMLHDSRGELDGVVAVNDLRVRLHLRRGVPGDAVAACLANATALRAHDVTRAAGCARLAVRIAQEHGLVARAGEAEFTLSVLLWESGDLTGALAAGERSASVLTAAGREAAVIPVAINNCRLARELRDATRTSSWARRADGLAGRVRDRGLQASAAFELNRAQHDAGELAAAIASARRAEALYRAEENWFNAAVTCENGALSAEDSGDVALARQWRATAVEHWRRCGNLPRLLRALVDLSALHVRVTEYEPADDALAGAIRAIRDEPGTALPPLLESEILARHAAVRLFTGTGADRHGTDLAAPAAADGTGDAELERLRAVLSRFHAGALSIDDARQQVLTVLRTETRHGPEMARPWLHDDLGAELAPRELKPG